MKRDSIVVAGCVFSLGFFVFSLFTGQGFFKFYPKMGKLFTKGDLLLIPWLFLGLFAVVIMHWSCHKWKFLRLRI